MVISHKCRYVFVEIPVTASYAIRNELCEHYDGEPILHKHSTYPEFHAIATDDEKEYFVFAGVRNPLDVRVSGYFKVKTNHKYAFTDLEAIKTFKIDYGDLVSPEILQNSNSTFESSFLRPKIWERPYSNMIELSSKYLDFVIRYENLQEDFAEVLRRLGIKQMRPLPVVNKTQGRKADWELYYTPKMIDKAKRVYGPFMQKWGYQFPEDWGDYKVSPIKKMEFNLVNALKRVYLTHFRYNDKPYAKLIRILWAYLRRKVI